MQTAYVYSMINRPNDALRLFAALEDAALDMSVGEASWGLANLARLRQLGVYFG